MVGEKNKKTEKTSMQKKKKKEFISSIIWWIKPKNELEFLFDTNPPKLKRTKLRLACFLTGL